MIMSASTIISEAYGESACLYETVLGVSRDATPSQLRKAYYKRCLSYHPDKLTSDLPDDEIENAKSKFRAISVAYSILSDEGKRKEYDESGDMYDEDDDDMATGKAGPQHRLPTLGTFLGNQPWPPTPPSPPPQPPLLVSNTIFA